MHESRGEFARLEALRPHLAGSGRGIPVGAGDDAAVLGTGGGRVVVCVDALVEGVHFRRDLSAPADIGWKAAAVNLSDLAAMGAQPEALLVALHRGPEVSEGDLVELYEGMAQAGATYEAPIVGGDTVTSPVWALSVTAIGRPVGPLVTRAGARPGDRVLLVGSLGMAAAALWLVDRQESVDPGLLAAHRRPRPLVASGMALARVGVSAMIDISDGLGADAGHVARSSAVRIALDEEALAAAVPAAVRAGVPADEARRLALGGGEDFALLAAVPPGRVQAVDAALADPDEAPAHWIGVIQDGEPGVWVGDERIDTWGYDHG